MGAGSASRCTGLDRGHQAITDAARSKNFSNFMMALALLKNYHAYHAPPICA